MATRISHGFGATVLCGTIVLIFAFQIGMFNTFQKMEVQRREDFYTFLCIQGGEKGLKIPPLMKHDQFKDNNLLNWWKNSTNSLQNWLKFARKKFIWRTFKSALYRFPITSNLREEMMILGYNFQ